MIVNLETETEKHRLEFVSPDPINVDMVPLDVDTMSKVSLDFRLKLFRAKMRYNTLEPMAYRTKIAKARRKYQETRTKYLRGIK